MARGGASGGGGFTNYGGDSAFGGMGGFIPSGEIRWQDRNGQWHFTTINNPGGGLGPGGLGGPGQSPTFPAGTGNPATTVPPGPTGAPVLPSTQTVPNATTLLPGLKGLGGIPWGKILDTAGVVGEVASAFGDSRDDEREDASLAAYRQNLANEARFRSLIEARRLALTAPQQRADNSLRGDRLANAQDLDIQLPSNIPKLEVTGGFRPSMWSENTRQLGRQMSTDALAGSGTDEIAPPGPIERAPDPNFVDTVLDTASVMSTIPYFRRRRTP